MIPKISSMMPAIAAPGIGSAGGRAAPKASLTCLTSSFVDSMAAFAEATWSSARRRRRSRTKRPGSCSSRGRTGKSSVSRSMSRNQIRSVCLGGERRAYKYAYRIPGQKAYLAWRAYKYAFCVLVCMSHTRSGARPAVRYAFCIQVCVGAYARL